MPYNFRNRADIDAVLELIGPDSPSSSRQHRVRESERIAIGWLFKTPAGGIPARTDTTCGVADCTAYFIDYETGELGEIIDADEESMTAEVYNVFSSPIAGDVFITAKEVTNVLVADAEDCVV